MVTQSVARRFPGHGIIYLEGGEGIKVVKTYTEAPKKSFNPDGSIAYSTPPPTIHELFGGGFCYADGLPVSNIEHLMNIPDVKMRERALKWFNGERVLSEAAKSDIPPLPPANERKHGEVIYLTSNDLDKENDPVTQKLNERVAKTVGQGEGVAPESSGVLSQILDGIKGLGVTVGLLQKVQKEQGAEIAELKKHPPAPKRMAMSEAAHKAQSEKMKARWADPEYKAKMLAKNPALKGKVKKDGQESPEGDQTV